MLTAVIVDDEVLAINLIARFLTEIGGVDVVATYTNSADALDFIKKQPPDLIFLDIEMPEIDGIRMGEILHTDNAFIDIIYVTAYDQYALKAFEVKATDYIVKPVQKDRLADSIQSIITRRKRHAFTTEKNAAVTETSSSMTTTSDNHQSLTARLMGSFVLCSKKDTQVKWRTKKVKELCAYLLSQEYPVHRYQVIEDLWPNTPLEKAVSILYTTVYQLRRVLQQQTMIKPISYVDERYSLSITIMTDVQQIKEILNQPPGREPAREELVSTLLDLTVHDFLDQEDYPWSDNQKTQLKTGCQQYLEGYALAVTDSDNAPDLRKRCLDKLIAFDPYNEQYYILLIKHFLRQHNDQEARFTHRAYKELIHSELGLDTPLRIDKLFND